MTLSEGDKAIVREIAFEVAGVMKGELKGCINTAIGTHAEGCEVKKKVARFIWAAAGAGIALGALGLATVPQVIAFIKHAAGAGL